MLMFWKIYFGLICLLFVINWSTGGLTTLGVRNFIARYISGIAALITGLTSIIKSKEQSILVFAVVVVCLFALLFLLGEFLIPH